MRVESRIIKQGPVEWRKCSWLQPENLKKQSKEQSEKLKRSLVNNGFASPLFVWEQGKTTWILDGHHRDRALKELEASGVTIPKMLPAVFLRCTNRKEAVKLCLVFSSQYARARESAVFEFMADFDPEDILPEIDIPGLNLVDFGREEVEEDDIPAPPKKPVTKKGELWVLGSHRLLCGDSSDPAAISLVMQDAKARLYATDPPYGVSLGETKAGMAGFEANQVGKPVQGDERRDAELQGFLESVFRAAVPHLENAAWYLWHAHLTQGFFAAAAAAADVLLHRQIVWVKPGLVFTRSGMYHWQHEPCFFGWVRGQQCAFYGKKNQTSVWQCGKGGAGLHATQKPVELFAIPIRNHLKEGEVCLETFAGSGSQLIAAEQLNRSCRAIEIDPAYCDVIIERWENLTGGKAKRAQKSGK